MITRLSGPDPRFRLLFLSLFSAALHASSSPSLLRLSCCGSDSYSDVVMDCLSCSTDPCFLFFFLAASPAEEGEDEEEDERKT